MGYCASAPITIRGILEYCKQQEGQIVRNIPPQGGLALNRLTPAPGDCVSVPRSRHNSLDRDIPPHSIYAGGIHKGGRDG